MKTYIFAIMALALGASCSLGAPHINVRVESQSATESKVISTVQLSTTKVRIYSYTEGELNTLTVDDFILFGYGTNWDLSTSMVLIEASANTTDNYFDLEIPASDLAQNGSFFWQAVQTNSTEIGSAFVLGKGTLAVSRSPITGGPGTLNLQQIVNWDSVQNTGEAPWVLTNNVEYLAAILATSTATSLVYSTGQEMISGTDGQVRDTAGNPVALLNLRHLQDSTATISYNWQTRTLGSSEGTPMLNHALTNYVVFTTNVLFGASPALSAGYIHAGVTGPIEIRANDTLELVATNGINVNSDTTLNGNLAITGQVYNVGINEIAYNASLDWDADNGNIQFVILTGNPTINLPSNIQPGATYMLLLQQDGTGTRTVTWAAGYDWGDGVSAPTLTTTGGKEDVITFVARSGSKFYAVPTIKGFTP